VSPDPTDPTGGELSAGELAYRWTRARILDATYPGGAMLSEGEVSRVVGVSRTPVREAFLRLAAEDMLQLFPKRGALVVPITRDEMHEVMEARLLVEPWAARITAGLPGRDGLAAALERAVADLEAAEEAGDLVAYQEHDRAFHQEIVAATGNRLVESFYRSLRDRQVRMGAAALTATADRPRTILEEHRAIARAIGEGTPELASAAVRTHIEGTRQALGLRSR
jgi:DNA-binding GntR family transcriptional regulator